MNMDFGLKLTQEQKLIMTQQMQLSVKILQMSAYELNQYLSKEVQENPVIDVSYTNSETEVTDYKKMIKQFEYSTPVKTYSQEEEKVSPFNYIATTKSFKDYLREQVLESNENKLVKKVCNYMIENLDIRGYLDSNIESIVKELQVTKDVAENALSMLQSFEPSGVGARDLKECLKIQLIRNNYNDYNIFTIIDEYLELIAENKYNIISKSLGITIKEAQKYGDIIKTLEPKPSRGFFTGEETKYIVPDAYIKEINNEYFIVMNDSILPRLNVNALYKNIINNDASDKELVKYVKDKLDSAVFLIKSIEQRKSTLYKVLEEIIKTQKEYFDYGELYLKPMTLKEISDNIGVHESTVSRAIRDKFISTNKGTIKIKDLFATGLPTTYGDESISSNVIKQSIKDLIDNEDKIKPLSDQKICSILNSKNMNISRRTVAKYREEMGVKSSSKRRRY